MPRFNDLIEHLVDVKTNRITKESQLRKYFEDLRVALADYLGCSDDLILVQNLNCESPDYWVNLIISIPLGEKASFGNLGTIEPILKLSGEYLDDPFLLFNGKRFELNPVGREQFIEKVYTFLKALNV